MKIVISIDSFKGSLSSLEAGNAAAEGVMRVFKNADITVLPAADGGEGTVTALTMGTGGNIVTVNVTGPLGKPINADYGIINDTAIIEAAAAAGLTLVDDQHRNPMNTTTYGLGEIIKDAISRGLRKFIIGIGGSATNDGGIGMLQALGFGILDDKGEQVPFGAKGLEMIKSITDDNVIPELKLCDFQIACDVTNPLCGDNGCSAIFAPQKGANTEDIRLMDMWLKKYADITCEKYANASAQHSGAGAAGGLGFAFMAYMNASLRPGVEIILEAINIEKHLKTADLVITGEGRLDKQSSMGKTPIGIAELAKKYNKPVIAFAGCVLRDASVCNDHGIDAFFPILREVCTLEDAMNVEIAKKNLADTAEQVMRAININI